MEVLICPYCLVRVSASRICPKCGEKLDEAEWPEVKGVDGVAPYLPVNLDPPESAGAPYRLKLLQNPNLVGRLAKGEVSLEGAKCVKIGSDPWSDVRIEGEKSVCAALMRNSYTKRFYLYDCGSLSGIYVNGERRHCCLLKSGDKITIAGNDMMFRENRICPYASVEGMAISVLKLSYSIQRKDKVKTILDNVSFAAAPGEFIAILGPSGCGKSSLVQCLIGLADADKSMITANGRSLHDKDVMEAFLSSTAYLPQNVEEMLHSFLTVRDEMDFFRRIHLPPGDSEEEDNEGCLSVLGLSGKSGERIGDLSGGEKKRVGIALALLRKPQLLLLDEPSAGLDPAAESELIGLLRDVAKRGQTVLCVTHVLSNLEKFDKVLALSKGGHVAYFGPPSGMLSSFNLDNRNYSALYKLLAKGVGSQRTDVLDCCCGGVEFREMEMPSFCRRIGGYFSRYAKGLFSKRLKAGANGKCRLFSMPALLFLWQPLCLVIGLRLACACYFRANGGKSVDLELLGFCASLSMFWIGINNSAREFVKERIPGRCLERLNQVPLGLYVLSKLIWTFLVCLLQSISFTVMFCVAGRIPVPLAEAVELPALAISPLWFGPLFVSCLTGTFFGLVISATAKKQIGAISVVPNVAIMALLFSNAVVQFEHGNGYYSPIARWLCVAVMPCHWASKVLDSIQSGCSVLQSTICMLAQFLLYACIAVLIVVWRQDKNERGWNGRNG